MQNQDEWLEYDEIGAAKYIRNSLPEELQKNVDNEHIYTIIDLIYDFYDETGILEGDDNEEIEIDVEELVNYIFQKREQLKFNHLSISEVELIVIGELNYCDSIGL
ncbi:MAG: hypothetical protein FWF54_08260 [Candidatus Azobacteroides sp.]|nr:hypothetical protein [Candidatus Azobacteroides sp.]